MVRRIHVLLFRQHLIGKNMLSKLFIRRQWLQWDRCSASDTRRWWLRETRPFRLSRLKASPRLKSVSLASRVVLLSEGRIGCLLDVFAVFKVLMKQLKEYCAGEMSPYSWASLNMDPDALQWSRQKRLLMSACDVDVRVPWWASKTGMGATICGKFSSPSWQVRRYSSKIYYVVMGDISFLFQSLLPYHHRYGSLQF